MIEDNQENKAIKGSISQIILKALKDGDKYGYEICKEIENLTEGKLILKQPSLYSCLRRMEEQNLISSYWEDSSLGGKRHYYSLTENGTKAFEDNKSNWENDDDLINSLPLNDNFYDNDENLELNDEMEDFENEEDDACSLTPSNLFVANQENLFSIENQKEEIELTTIEENNEENNKSFFQFDLFNENVSFVKNDDANDLQKPKVFENKFSQLDNNQQDFEPLKQMNSNKSNLDNESLNEEKKEITRPDLELPKTENISKNSNANSKKNISWDESFFDKKEEVKEDYKDIIGQLYSNSRLPDPYEQNKYQNFKEIFPSSKFEKQFDKNDSSEEVRNSNIDNLIKSNVNSNIDCEDMKNLNDLYKLQGIEIKLHQNRENINGTKCYTDKNKLNMTSSLIVSLIMLLEIMFSYIIFKNSLFLSNKQRIVFYLSLAFTLSFALIPSLENLFDRYRLVIIDKKFKKSFMQRLFLFIFFIVVIFASNIMCGMTSLSQSTFMCYWVLPTLLSTNLLVFPIVYYSLLKSKVYSK